jgi:hypothetical protein
VRCAFDLEENRYLRPGEPLVQFRDVERVFFRVVVELHLLCLVIARDIGVSLRDRRFDGSRSRFFIGAVPTYVDGVAHDERRLGRLQNNDCLNALRATHTLDCL